MTRGSWLRRVLTLADSPIARDVPRRAALVMAALSVASLAFELFVIPRVARMPEPLRIAPSLAAVVVFALLAPRSFDAIGARLKPLPDVRFWVRCALAMAIAFAVVLGIGFAVTLAAGSTLEPVPPPGSLYEWYSGVVEGPAIEEIVFRWAGVTGLVALGPRWRWPIIAVNGVAFAYGHIIYDAHAANNMTAGFVFAWMYLRSGSIVVPFAFHALGNFVVGVLNLVAQALGV